MKKGAPQAREVSDRWHLVKNLAGWVSVLLASCLAQLRRPEVAAARSEQAEEQPFKPAGRPNTGYCTGATGPSSRAKGSLRAHLGTAKTRDEKSRDSAKARCDVKNHSTVDCSRRHPFLSSPQTKAAPA